MQLNRPCSPSDIERAAIAEWNARNPESLKLAREFAEQRGLIKKPQPAPTPDQVEADLKAMHPVEIDGRPMAPQQALAPEAALVGPVPACLTAVPKTKYQVEQKGWLE